MNEKQQKELREIDERLGALSNSFLSEQPYRAFSALRIGDGGATVKLSGNTEGLVYLASILIGLAKQRSPGQHFYFGEDEQLDVAERELILLYESAEWDRS